MQHFSFHRNNQFDFYFSTTYSKKLPFLHVYGEIAAMRYHLFFNISGVNNENQNLIQQKYILVTDHFLQFIFLVYGFYIFPDLDLRNTWTNGKSYFKHEKDWNKKQGFIEWGNNKLWDYWKVFLIFSFAYRIGTCRKRVV